MYYNHRQKLLSKIATLVVSAARQYLIARQLCVRFFPGLPRGAKMVLRRGDNNNNNQFVSTAA